MDRTNASLVGAAIPRLVIPLTADAYHDESHTGVLLTVSARVHEFYLYVSLTK